MRHKRKIEGSPGVQLSLIITPMLDMSFQILAFFIMTYHPAALEGHIPGNLTPPENPATKSKDPVLPSDPPGWPDFAAPIISIISRRTRFEIACNSSRDLAILKFSFYRSAGKSWRGRGRRGRERFSQRSPLPPGSQVLAFS